MGYAMGYACWNHLPYLEIVSDRMVPAGFDDSGRLTYRRRRTEWLVLQCVNADPMQDARCRGCRWRQTTEGRYP